MYRFLLTLFFLAAVATITKAGSEVEMGTVTGTIVHAETKKPVANVAFSALLPNSGHHKSIITDDHGNFTIRQVPVGEHVLIIDKRGYKLYRKEGVQVKRGTQLKLYIELQTEEQGGLHSNMVPITLHTI